MEQTIEKVTHVGNGLFTSGPWKSRALNGEHPGKRVYKGTIEIATCHYGAPLDHLEAEANARLIAAAPDYHAFVVDFIEWIEALRKVERDRSLPGMETIERNARAAIAKATGK